MAKKKTASTKKSMTATAAYVVRSAAQAKMADVDDADAARPMTSTDGDVVWVTVTVRPGGDGSGKEIKAGMRSCIREYETATEAHTRIYGQVVRSIAELLS